MDTATVLNTQCLLRPMLEINPQAIHAPLGATRL